MSRFESVLGEVRRISAGGMPPKVHETAYSPRPLTARELGWQSTPEVLRLLEKVEQKACASGGEHQGNSK